MTYSIIRFFSDDKHPRQSIKQGLSLAEAKEHCNDPSTSGELPDGTKWFDGFEED